MLIKGIIFISILVFLLGVLLYVNAKRVERENKIVESYVKASESFFVEIAKRVETTRHYRHDLNNYIQMLEALLEKEEKSEIVKEYMATQKQRYADLSVQRLCHDEFINTIIQMKREECAEKEIDFHIEIENTDYCGMEEIDKVCLFMNLLDNAIEATEKIPEEDKRFVRVEVKKEGEQLQIYMQNSMLPNRGFSFLTTKQDKENHGIGTTIIRKIVNKYNGKRQVEIDADGVILTDCVTCYLKEEVII